MRRRQREAAHVVAMFGLVALVLSSIVPLLTAQEANITDPPRAVNISVGGLAEFNCTAAANELFWYRNGRQMHNGTDGVIISPTVAVGNVRKSNLKIKVTSTDDSANITCYAYYTESLSNAEATALLLVQGKLKPVHNLSVVSINSTAVLISWSPPFTLEGVPILAYSVTITNTTSGENEMLSVEGDTTMLYYTIDHPDQVDNFTVTLICINQVGAGEEASMIFSMSVDSVVSTVQVISSTSVMASILTRSVTPVVSSTVVVNQSDTPIPFTENQQGIIAVVITIIVVVAVFAIVCTCLIIAVVYYRDRKKQKQSSRAQGQDLGNTSLSKLVRQEEEDKDQEGDGVPDQNNILDQLQGNEPTQSLNNGNLGHVPENRHLHQTEQTELCPIQNGLSSQTEVTEPPNQTKIIQTKPLSELLESIPPSQDISSDQGVLSDTAEESSPEDETDGAKAPLLGRLLSYQPDPPDPLYDDAVYYSLDIERLKAASSKKKKEMSKPGETQALLDDVD